jgi:hypothetical protein
MKTLNINGEVRYHVGEPLDVKVRDYEGWAGRSNFLSSNERERSVQLKDLEDCFRWAEEWLRDAKSSCCYVLDYASRTAYYDSEETLKHLREFIIPMRNLQGYFQNFTQRSFKTVPPAN